MEVVGAVIEGKVHYIDEIQRSLGPPRLRQGHQGCSAAPAAGEFRQSCGLGLRMRPRAPKTAPGRALVAGGLPVDSLAHRYIQRNLQRSGGAHLRADEILDLLRFARRHLEDQLVVHLQQKAGVEAAFG